MYFRLVWSIQLEYNIAFTTNMSTVPNQDNRNSRYGYQIMAADAIGSSGNLLFSPDISVTHRIILIHDNCIHVYTNNYVFVLHNSWIFSEKTRFMFWGCDNRNYFVG